MSLLKVTKENPGFLFNLGIDTNGVCLTICAFPAFTLFSFIWDLERGHIVFCNLGYQWK